MSTRRRKEALAPLSQRELDVLKTLALVLDGTRTQAEAARLLNLTPRHVRRLVARLRADGDQALRHGLRGRPSNRQADTDLRQRVLQAYRTHFHDFGPTLACEKLAELDYAWQRPSAVGSLKRASGSPARQRDPRELPLVRAGATILGNGILAKADNLNVVFCQMVPWQFDSKKPMNQKRTFRRASYLVTRLVANMGAAGSTPLLARFRNPVEASKKEERWLEGFYLDAPEEWDDPYRFFRW